ncbi:antibiotic biosynthesis monooxygenase family protein [Maribacter sp. 2-571]|uniref:antibiotic biosynthesis monooxygenase family protein n=1 Tax=Maribacter sp. 2-571 TaxID=3417569 RepID=UPI003D3408CE
MVTRIWEGRTKIEHSETYTKIIRERDIPDYKKTKGFTGLKFLNRSDDQYTYFKLLTFWEDFDAIVNFTGPNMERPKHYDSDKSYLLDFPGKVSHYTVFAQ